MRSTGSGVLGLLPLGLASAVRRTFITSTELLYLAAYCRGGHPSLVQASMLAPAPRRALTTAGELLWPAAACRGVHPYFPLRVGLITRRGQWRPGGWQNGRRGRSRRSGLQCAASPSVGKKDSRFCDPRDKISCCNGLVSCGSDGAGCKAGCPLLNQHLTDFVPVIPFSPITVAAGGRSLSSTSAPVKSLHFPSLRWSRRGPPLLWQTPWSLLVMPPLVPPIRWGAPHLVEAGRRGMGFNVSDVSGVKHQDLWLCGIGC